jgi:hypothetical protein
MRCLQRGLSGAAKRDPDLAANEVFFPKMSTPAPQQSALSLPELQGALLDAATVRQLFEDIEHCTEVTEIIPKSASRTFVSETKITLADAREQLLSGQLKGMQIRYRYQGGDWWDTLLPVEDRFRLVRIRHDFAVHLSDSTTATPMA